MRLILSCIACKTRSGSPPNLIRQKSFWVAGDLYVIHIFAINILIRISYTGKRLFWAGTFFCCPSEFSCFNYCYAIWHFCRLGGVKNMVKVYNVSQGFKFSFQWFACILWWSRIYSGLSLLCTGVFHVSVGYKSGITIMEINILQY